MSEGTQLEQELERRLAVIEAEELDDPVHAALSGRSLAVFLAVAAGIVVLSALGVAL
ncbi:hypothetical protein [Leucobacter luti]|uniref:Uncharacterized protein n=1 Tax=Leucobacter luti TaxID=340320 RepID=A0A4R6RTN5_9MICO|nr:hypothetical protein [Leucobacter luti]MCW2289945.1 hypothetical protein [Leucobacter luti]QYM76898.1 hypothetical protein K1X41_05820 [Leucobacter luti]TCK33259.1 hypothetical protein EDF60_3092 [Leucobacter luti]TDP89697.1 hypothetical protein EDF62_2991 [Leucobacter luti]